MFFLVALLIERHFGNSGNRGVPEMLGLVRSDDQVSYRDNNGNTHKGRITSVSDDGSWCDFEDAETGETTQVPTAELHLEQ